MKALLLSFLLISLTAFSGKEIKADKVYICVSSGATVYHQKKTCRGLRLSLLSGRSKGECQSKKKNHNFHEVSLNYYQQYTNQLAEHKTKQRLAVMIRSFFVLPPHSFVPQCLYSRYTGTTSQALPTNRD